MPVSWPSPTQIIEHYLRSREALSALRSSLDQPGAITPRSRFSTMTPGEVREALREMATELDRQVVLMLVAGAEASLRTDFNDRVRQRRKDPLSRGFLRLVRDRKAKGGRGVKLDEILDLWGREAGDPALKSAVAAMKKLLLYRHWLAHGGYWVENRSGPNDPDPFEAWRILRRFFNAIPSFNRLPDY